jgi:hypothetical protein
MFVAAGRAALVFVWFSSPAGLTRSPSPWRNRKSPKPANRTSDAVAVSSASPQASPSYSIIPKRLAQHGGYPWP